MYKLIDELSNEMIRLYTQRILCCLDWWNHVICCRLIEENVVVYVQNGVGKQIKTRDMNALENMCLDIN